jgi:glucosamine--fructose-6-phosphate aminotransferase (isomerizing)
MSSLLEEEIASQPAVIRQLLEAEAPHIAQIIGELPPFEYALIAARGSSDHTALYATYAWAALAGHPVSLATPSLYSLYKTAPRLDGALVVGISQSGQSPDILAVLEEGKRQGRPTLAITNDSASPLAALADHVVDLRAGPEQSVAATKTYTAELTVLAAFAALWSGDQQRLEELRRLPDTLEATLQGTRDLAQRVERYRYMDQCVIIGRGYNYATSFELALKLKELTYVMATGYSSADFRHGPIATIAPGAPVILVMPAGQAYDDMLDLAASLQGLGAELLVISDVPQALALAKTPLPIAGPTPEWLSPLNTVLPGQRLALLLALARGINPDVPRGLQKVTRTL